LQVSQHGSGQLKAFGGFAHIVGVETHGEFTVMDADNVKAVGMIFAVPAFQAAEIADAVDAGVLPEIDQENVSAVALDGMQDLGARGRGVNPLGIESEIRGLFWFLFFRECGGRKEK
jgi:hypothetical protein